MKKDAVYLTVLITVVMFFPAILFPQTTISSGDLLSLTGKSYQLEQDTSSSIQVNVGEAGANRVWDFSAMVLEDPFLSTSEFMAPGVTPFAAEFPNANLAQKISSNNVDFDFEFYNYLNVTSNLLYDLGSGNYSATEPQFNSLTFRSYDPTPLPMQFGATWTTTWKDTTEFGGTGGSILMDSTVNTVDAWGTVKLASGDYDCLRIRSDSWTITQLYITGFEFPPDSVFSISYVWVSRDFYTVASAGSQNDENNPNFTDAAYFTRLAGGAVNVEDDRKFIPSEYSLEQNYPNPFNPTTEIRFSIPEASRVSLKIYDVAGREVKTMIDEDFSAGVHSSKWDGRNDRNELVPSGVYFYRLTAGTFVEVKKALLLK